MPVLKSLSFTALPKSANDPIPGQVRCQAGGQKQPLKDPNHVRIVQRWIKVDGEWQATTKH
jgi:hypothetical protein